MMLRLLIQALTSQKFHLTKVPVPHFCISLVTLIAFEETVTLRRLPLFIVLINSDRAEWYTL